MGFIRSAPTARVRRWQRDLRSFDGCFKFEDAGLYLLVTGADLVVIEVVESQVLAEDKQVLGTVVALEGGGNVLWGGFAAGIAVTGRTLGSVCPPTMSRRMASPVTPVMSRRTLCR